ncbi:hypothetical protein LY76DRAFT_353894 [Colletotrichum caudatum]|nr:hypothetical protein LY76DRAFT_353894 [Colletotrichum caudatum]
MPCRPRSRGLIRFPHPPWCTALHCIASWPTAPLLLTLVHDHLVPLNNTIGGTAVDSHPLRTTHFASTRIWFGWHGMSWHGWYGSACHACRLFSSHMSPADLPSNVSRGLNMQSTSLVRSSHLP